MKHHAGRRSGSCTEAGEKATLRVLHIASGDAWGGAERVLTLLAQGLLSHGGVALDVLLLNDGRLADDLRRTGIRVHVIEEGGRTFAQLVRAVHRWIADRTFDVLHLHRYKEIVLGILAGARRVHRIVVTIHGLPPSSQLKTKERLRIWGALWLAKISGAEFVGVSDEVAGRLVQRLGRTRVVRIPNPVPTVPARNSVDLRACLGWDTGRPIVGFIGRLEHVKGPDAFLDVAACSPQGPGFVLIGNGSMQSGLLARMSSGGLGDRVAFLGEVPDATSYLSQLDVLAITSRHEGLPMVLLEAAACGIPVVAFDVGGVREVLDGSVGARLVPAGDVGGFSAALEEVLVDGEKARAAAARWGNTVRARFGLPHMVSSYLALYHGGTERPT